jgi:superfamily II DNA or RNA helicase
MKDRVAITVEASLRVRLADLDPKVADELRQACSHSNPEHHKLTRLGLHWRAKSVPRVIRSWREEAGFLVLPRGVLAKVRDVFAQNGIHWSVRDARTEGDETLVRKDLRSSVQLRDYQEDAKDAAIARQNCIVRAPTGSGKTTLALALAAELNLPTLVVLWTGGLYKQWEDRLIAELGLKKSEVGHWRGSTFKPRQITLAMQQTIAKQLTPERAALFGVVIGDEIQRYAAKTFFDVIDRMPAKYRIGVSADERRKDGKEFLVYDVFGSVAYEIKRDELEDRGVVHDVEVRVVPTAFRCDWYKDALARMKEGDGAQDVDFNGFLDELTRDEARNLLALDLLVQEVRAGNQVVALSQRVAHCVLFDSMLASMGVQSGLLVGGAGASAQRFGEAKAGLLSGHLRAAAGTLQAIGTGIDVPSVSRGVVATPWASSRQNWNQVRGRLCRSSAGKTDAAVYYLWDREVYGMKHLRNLVSWNRRVLVRDGEDWIEGREYLKRSDGTSNETEARGRR